MEKQQEAKPIDTMEVDNNSASNHDDNSKNSKSSETDPELLQKRGIKKKKLRGLDKKEAELVPNTTGKKQGFVTYAVTYEDEDDIFKKMKISSHKPLEDASGRSKCPQCDGNRKYFCYSCFCVVGMPEDQVPRLKLPVHVDILHWPTELTSKATGIHAKVLAPDHVQFWEYPNMPEFNYDETLILYPTEEQKVPWLTRSDLTLFVLQDAVTMKDMDIEEAKKIKHVVFVDSQWHSAHRILKDDRLLKVKCVKITSQKTRFWRYQMCGEECLATIEAIYYFFKEYQQCVSGGNYNGEYDDLLYYYAFFYNMIQDKYRKSNKNFPRIKNYIKKSDDNNNADNSEANNNVDNNKDNADSEHKNG